MKQMIPVFLVLLSLCITPTLVAETIAVLPEVVNPSGLVIDNGQIFVTDKEAVHIYNLKDFKLVKSFGKKGEGPGEFKNYQNLEPYPSFLEINSRNKVVYFTREGEFIREKKLDQSIRNISSVGNVFFARKRVVDRKAGISTTEFVILDKDFNQIKCLAVNEDPMRFIAGGKFHMKILYPQIHSTVYQDKIYLTDANKGFYIAIYNTKGELVKEIRRDYKKEKVTEKYKTAFLNNMKKSSRNFERMKDRFKLDFAEYFPAISYIQVYPGVIYLTHEKEPGVNYKVTLLDHDGKLIKTGTRRSGLTSTFYNGRIYYLIENEDEEQWELTAEDL